MLSDSFPSAVTCPQCRSQLQVLRHDSDRGRCPLCHHTFAVPPVLEIARADDLPRVIPVNNGFLEGDFIWNAGIISGLCLMAFGVLWWALSWQLGFSNRWAAIPVVLGIAAMIRSLWRTTKAVVP